jgi:hypothetical protein
MKNKILTGVVVLVVFFGLWFMYFRENNQNSLKNTITTEMTDYKNSKGGYVAKVPLKWEVEESTESGKFKSRTVWQVTEDGTYLGNMSQISITVIATPEAKQPLSAQKEFDEWFSKKDGSQATDSGITKVENELISSQSAVMLKEEEVVKEDIPSSFFSYTSWFRKDGINYYINTMGNGLFSDFEKKYFKIILDSFRLL